MLLSKEYFDEIADQWDAMQKSFFSEDVREFAYALAGVKAGKTAVDLGAGTGFMTHGLLKAGLNVYAVDQSEEMLSLLKEKYKDCETLACIAADGTKLPLPDSFADYVFANMFLHHVQDPAAAIREMYRILKPDGIAVITDLDEHSFTELQTDQHDVWLGFKREDILEWFKKADFRKPATHCVGCNCSTKAKGSCGQGDISVSIFAGIGTK